MNAANVSTSPIVPSRGAPRRLVYGLRPPALDDLGLIESLREQSVRLGVRPGGGIAVSLNVPDRLPALSAAVEVATYRIVTEAMTNAARHSGAGRIEITLALEGADGLRVEIHDDGTGPAAGWQPGVGVTSMRERAAELGGSCRFGPGPDGGSLVTALLPLAGRATPTETSPDEAAPAEAIPAEAVPHDTAQAETAQAETVPTEPAPFELVQNIPARGK